MSDLVYLAKTYSANSLYCRLKLQSMEKGYFIKKDPIHIEGNMFLIYCKDANYECNCMK